METDITREKLQINDEEKINKKQQLSELLSFGVHTRVHPCMNGLPFIRKEHNRKPKPVKRKSKKRICNKKKPKRKQDTYEERSLKYRPNTYCSFVNCRHNNLTSSLHRVPPIPPLPKRDTKQQWLTWKKKTIIRQEFLDKCGLKQIPKYCKKFQNHKDLKK